ncbi:OsmC family protein [Paracidovorax wautersii]|uniref:Redox protein n=1 Tax=Paracidovorax wautersii TaxID=1177982 RepID=A0ABU1IEX3_9BURK|nr:OsmC family protein [Paracidovorax wautersii]MDR6215767.1 putative redox protein [Paracidovorax wautersii]
MTVQLQRIADLPMGQAVTIRSHALIADGSVEEGGSDAGPSPHDLYDAALGACKALTVLWYARRKGWAVDDVRTAVDRDASAERAGTYRLATRLLMQGDLTDAQLAELEAVAAKCPVHKLMTAVTTEITTRVERAPQDAAVAGAAGVQP